MKSPGKCISCHELEYQKTNTQLVYLFIRIGFLKWLRMQTVEQNLTRASDFARVYMLGRCLDFFLSYVRSRVA